MLLKNLAKVLEGAEFEVSIACTDPMTWVG